MALHRHHLGLHEVRPAHPDLRAQERLGHLPHLRPALGLQGEEHVLPPAGLLEHPHPRLVEPRRVPDGRLWSLPGPAPPPPWPPRGAASPPRPPSPGAPWPPPAPPACPGAPGRGACSPPCWTARTPAPPPCRASPSAGWASMVTPWPCTATTLASTRCGQPTQTSEPRSALATSRTSGLPWGSRARSMFSPLLDCSNTR